MCLAINGKVISIKGKYAIVDVMGVKTKVNIILLEDIKVGDIVLVHTGFAIQKIDEIQNLILNETLNEMLNHE